VLATVLSRRQVAMGTAILMALDLASRENSSVILQQKPANRTSIRPRLLRTLRPPISAGKRTRARCCTIDRSAWNSNSKNCLFAVRACGIESCAAPARSSNSIDRNCLQGFAGILSVVRTVVTSERTTEQGCQMLRRAVCGRHRIIQSTARIFGVRLWASAVNSSKF
jgi:hypothetical protein